MVSWPVYRIFVVDDHPAVRAGIKDQPGGSNDQRAAGEAVLVADGIAQAAALYLRSIREHSLVTGRCV